MNGNSTTIRDPRNSNKKPHTFHFDYSYWSHDGYTVDAEGICVADPKHPNCKKFASQKRVFEDLGVGVLNNSWNGYNSTLFAYGQTGSGKSWSIVGYEVNKGIVPLLCEQLFAKITEKKQQSAETAYEVTISMLEIYNEKVRDLLEKKTTMKNGLKVRENPQHGFYAEGLKVVPVDSYKNIEQKISSGTLNRSVAATKMNETSSRAHTIVGITFIQKFKNDNNEETTKTSIINLVDLAGSERVGSTEVQGQQLKEGASINRSLSALGNCISALVEKMKSENTNVPYRDSTLTRLLKNALGGNSKTIMIAAISPADINYEESLSTLRYANRAKQIKTVATVNEDQSKMLVCKLQEENERLKQLLESGNIEIMKLEGEEDRDLTEEEKVQIRKELEEEYKCALEENNRKMKDLQSSFEERLKEAQMKAEDVSNISKILAKKKSVAHIYNLNVDPQLTGYIVYFLESAQTLVGSPKDENKDKKEDDGQIYLSGPSIAEQHAIITESAKEFTIEPGSPDVRILVNGKSVTFKTDLHHNDRILFGTTQYFVYCNPKKRDSSKEKFPVVTFDMAQEEIARGSGFDMSQNKTTDDALLQEELLEILPAVSETNSISEVLKKNIKFDVIIVSAQGRGELTGRTQVMVKVLDLESRIEWIWQRQKFFDRKFVMQEMYQNYVEKEEWKLPQNQDPFYDDPAEPLHIGSVKVWLSALSHMIETKEQLHIMDYQGQYVGMLKVEIVPCDKTGKEINDDDIFVDSPSELIGQDVNFVVKIVSAQDLPTRFTDTFARYQVYLDEHFIATEKIKDTSNPEWNHSKVFSFPTATKQFVSYLHDDAIMVQIWGRQKQVTMKNGMMNDMLIQSQRPTPSPTIELQKFVDKLKLVTEMNILKKKQTRMQLKLDFVQKMIVTAEKFCKKKLSTDLIKQIYNANTADVADKCLKLIELEKDDEEEKDDDVDESQEPSLVTKDSQACFLL